MPDRLIIVFTNSVTDDVKNDVSYLHDCSNTEPNIFSNQTFKIKWPTVPSSFDNVYFGRHFFPVPGTNLKDNFILEGKIIGVYDDSFSCQNVDRLQGPDREEQAFADRYRIFYRRGSIENQIVKDNMVRNGKKQKYLDMLRRYANDTGCDGCHGWKWFGCLAEWQSQIPEGFSCAKAVASNKPGCKEVYQPVACSNLVVKVAPGRMCRRVYNPKSCPMAYMGDKTLRNKYCVQMDRNGEYYGSEDEGIGNWVLIRRGVQDLTCCVNSHDCCNDCFAEPLLRCRKRSCIKNFIFSP